MSAVDSQALGELLTLERRTVVAYESALATGLLGRESSAAIRLLRAHEADHARALEDALRALGVTPPARAPDRRVPGLAGAASERDVLAFARELEEIGVAAYYDALQKLRGADQLTLAARIMAVEGQHLVLVRERLGGTLVPEAFETGET